MASKQTEISRGRVLAIIVGVVLLIAASVAFVFNAALDQVEPADEIVQDSSENEQDQTGEPTFGFQRTATGFEGPVGLVFGNDQMYVVEQSGLVKQMSDGQVVLNIQDRVKATGNELGLLGMVFEPDFETEGSVYLNYTRSGGEEATDTQSVISRFQMSNGTIDPNSEQVILTIDQPYNNHNGGDLAFGPDGYLYIPMGDGGSAGDPDNQAQDLSNLLGKILRIDVVGQETYVVPEDNPFVDKLADQNGRDEIWTYGWRNPWRMSFDPFSGDAFVGDVGQKGIEEISVIDARDSGRNYGWRCFEGSEEYDTSGCDLLGDFGFPFAEYDHTDADRCSGSVTGGYVYRGQDYKNLEGMYVFADFCTGVMYRQDVDDSLSELIVAAETDFMISTFGVDGQGEIYFADLPNGTIYKLIDTSTR